MVCKKEIIYYKADIQNLLHMILIYKDTLINSNSPKKFIKNQ